MVLAASFAWMVGQHEVPGQRRVHRHFGGSPYRGFSPTIIMSGSWRSMERSAPANVIPARVFTCACATPANWYFYRRLLSR